ncbi:MAG: class I SAM-dependent methyltransferase [Silicimonas sp.]|nr:class I SAM-dependent methyltransferase [Silicimonas sp.]
MSAEKEHVAINKAHWDGMADHWVALGERLWALEVPEWGIWHTPDRRAPLLPTDMTGMDAVELGCGTGYVAGWMARRGAKVTAIDVSPRQLETAKRLALQYDAPVTFIEGDAEITGLPDAAFDFAVSEYGAAIWCDPAVWLREAYRILRPGGRLSFLGTHPLMILATPQNGAACDFGLHRPYRDMGRIDWSDAEVEPGGMEFNLSFEGWITLFADIGFQVTGYRELYASKTNTTELEHVTADWARRYPTEHVWWLQKSP